MYERKFVGEKGRPRNVAVFFGFDVDKFPARDDEVEDDGPRWNEIEWVEQFLWKEELILLDLMRNGKGPSDIATIMGLQLRSTADKEMKRLVSVVKFFLTYEDAIKALYRPNLPLSRKEVLTARAFAVDRMNYQDIAKLFGNKSMFAVWSRLRNIKKKIGEGWPKVVRMLEECSTRPGLRKKVRDIMVEELWRQKLKDYLVGQTGKIFYSWGGQDLEHGTADCSGLVLEVLKKFGKLPDDFQDRAALGLSRYFPKTAAPKPGDLVFYGRDWNNVTHCMFYLGKVEYRHNCVAGMCGGRKGMGVKEARLVGAALWVRYGPRYRKDFLGYRKVM